MIGTAVAPDLFLEILALRFPSLFMVLLFGFFLDRHLVEGLDFWLGATFPFINSGIDAAFHE
jgi:hypothetical protein